MTLDRTRLGVRKLGAVFLLRFMQNMEFSLIRCSIAEPAPPLRGSPFFARGCPRNLRLRTHEPRFLKHLQNHLIHNPSPFLREEHFDPERGASKTFHPVRVKNEFPLHRFTRQSQNRARFVPLMRNRAAQPPRIILDELADLLPPSRRKRTLDRRRARPLEAVQRSLPRGVTQIRRLNSSAPPRPASFTFRKLIRR